MHDAGHDATELILRETEVDVARVYRQAAEEMQKKLDDYLRKFKVKDRIKREQLRKGEITKEEYDYWRTGQIAIGKRWEEMKNTLAQDLHNSNNIARSIVRGHMPEVYAVNHNYGTFQVEKESLVDTSYTLYDRQTVERLIRDQPELLPPPGPRMKERLAAGKDIAWQKGQIQSVMTQAILQGESIPNIARRIARTMGESNRKSTVRYARTAATGAQNAGRVDSYKRAEDMGIELEQEWLATLDLRTRDAHRQLDGQHVPVGKPFNVDGEEIMFPGDPTAPGYLIWNCRCTLVPRLKSLDQSNAPRNSRLGDMSYEEWKNEHQKEQPAFQFTPASTIQEAEKYISQYVDSSRFGALGVSYQGISVDVANEVNKTIGKFYETFNVEKFGGIIAPAGNTKYGKLIQNATAAYTDIRRSFLLNRKSLKTMSTATKALQAERSAITDVLLHPEKYDLSKVSSRLLRVLENSRVSGRGTIPQTIEEVINHELGHSLERQLKQHSQWGAVLENMPKYNQRVSGYACDSVGEYVAESFCSYMKGESIIDPVLSSIFDSLRRR